MAVINRRNRLVNFRLSEQELDTLKTLCHSNGARSISDFARNAVLRSLDTVSNGMETPHHKIENLDHKMSELETRMGLLLQLLEVRGTGSGREPVGFAQTA